jgi:hypothetical protein
MNVFNIREVESLLKRKFFTDIINSKDHHLLLNKTSIATRFKTNNINTLNNNIFLTYLYGPEKNFFIKNNIFQSLYLSENNNFFFFNKLKNFFFINLID